MAALLPTLIQYFFDDDGIPLVGGMLYSYIAGTSTPLATYTDASGGTPNTNPVVLNGSGQASVYLGTGYYKFVLEDALGNVIWTVDNVNVPQSDVIPSGWSKFAITDGQSATALTGMTVTFASFSSAVYNVEIIRGTGAQANGQIAIQEIGGGRVVAGGFLCNEPHGITFSVNVSSGVATLYAAASSGPGNGTIKLQSLSVPA